MRSEELRYAKFMARRHCLARVVHPHEFKHLVSQVSFNMVYYDPNFDFSQHHEPLHGVSDTMMHGLMSVRPSSYHEVRFPNSAVANTFSIQY